MEKLILHKGKTKNADIYIPSSKSYIHRYIISASLADGVSRISNVSMSNDIDATLSCVENLGASYNLNGDTIEVNGGLTYGKDITLNCGESASTLRFMVPVSIAKKNNVRLTGTSTLMNRPLSVYEKIFNAFGVKYDYRPGEYIDIDGQMPYGEIEVAGNISSQFITGLLYTLPTLSGDSILNITSDPESQPYIDITLDVLEKSGIEIEKVNNRQYKIKGNQIYTARDFVAEGDYSQAAFFLVAGMFAGGIRLHNLGTKTRQGDSAIVDLLKAMGGNIYFDGDVLCAEKSNLKAIGEIDAKEFPDIVPVLSLACALAEGKTVIKNIERLRIKECDRVEATVDMLKRFGADITSTQSEIIINGKDKLNSAEIDTFNDHRIAMTASIASLVCDGDVVIQNPKCVNKSYPRFFEDFGKLMERSIGKEETL